MITAAYNPIFRGYDTLFFGLYGHPHMCSIHRYTYTHKKAKLCFKEDITFLGIIYLLLSINVKMETLLKPKTGVLSGEKDDGEGCVFSPP